MKTNDSAEPVSVAELSALSFFAGISPEHMAQIARYSKRRHFAAGDTIFEQGEAANRFYVLRSGRVQILCSVGEKHVPVQEIVPGEPVGFSWFFTPENLHFNAVAMEPVHAIFFYGTLLREECDLDPELGYELMRRTGAVLVKRLEALMALLAAQAK